MSDARMYGDDAGPCPKCGRSNTHVSYESIEDNYCRDGCGYFKPAEASHE